MTLTTTTRDRLIEAASELLHEHPYHAVGVQTLCEYAGVRKGSFYHYFQSKEELTIAAMDAAWEAYKIEVGPIVTGGGGADDRLRRLVEACLTSTRVHSRTGDRLVGCPFARLAASLSPDETDLRLRLAEIFEEWADLLTIAADGDRSRAWAALAEIQGRLLLTATTGHDTA